MGLNKYLPNKTLIWKELKTSGSAILAFWAFITFISSFQLFRAISSIVDALKQGYQVHGVTDLMNQIDHLLALETGGQGFLLTVLVIFIAAWDFGSERQHNTFNLLLAMPYSRRDVLYNKLIVGLGQLVTIFVLNAVIMTLLVWANNSIPFPFKTIDIWLWALQSIIILGFIFTFTMFIGTISGTQLGNFLLSLIFLFFPMGMFVLIGFNLDMWRLLPSLLSGVNLVQNIILAITVPVYLISNAKIGQSFNMTLAYSMMIIAGVVIYELTQYLFTKNHMENNGEILMFPKLEGFFKLGVAVCLTLLGLPIVVRLFNLNPPHGGMNIVYVFIYLLLGVTSWSFISWLFKWRREGVK